MIWLLEVLDEVFDRVAGGLDVVSLQYAGHHGDVFGRQGVFLHVQGEGQQRVDDRVGKAHVKAEGPNQGKVVLADLPPVLSIGKELNGRVFVIKADGLHLVGRLPDLGLSPLAPP